MDEARTPEETAAAVQWKPYRYENGAWEEYPIDDYLDRLEPLLREAFKDDPSSTTRTILIATGPGREVMAAQAAYLSFYYGWSMWSSAARPCTRPTTPRPTRSS